MSEATISKADISKCRQEIEKLIHSGEAANIIRLHGLNGLALTLLEAASPALKVQDATLFAKYPETVNGEWEAKQIVWGDGPYKSMDYDDKMRMQESIKNKIESDFKNKQDEHARIKGKIDRLNHALGQPQPTYGLEYAALDPLVAIAYAEPTKRAELLVKFWEARDQAASQGAETSHVKNLDKKNRPGARKVR